MNHRVHSVYTYPKEFRGPKPIQEQIISLSERFDLDPSHARTYALNLPPLASFVPADALEWTGYFSILYEGREFTAKYLPEVQETADRYRCAMQITCNKIEESRPFCNYCAGIMAMSHHLRVHPRTARAMDLIAQQQKGDILIIAAQLGMCHRGRSVRDARAAFAHNEFGLGGLAVGSILLTHPERLGCEEELDMNCPGDEVSPNADSDFSRAPFFGFGEGEVGFGTYWIESTDAFYGSVSAFLP